MSQVLTFYLYKPVTRFRVAGQLNFFLKVESVILYPSVSMAQQINVIKNMMLLPSLENALAFQKYRNMLII